MKFKKLIIIVLFMVLSLMLLQEDALAAQEADELIVILDAGHDDVHAGSQNGDLGEEDLVFKIAEYCKEELEKYEGVTVYTTRDGYGCANGGVSITSASCNAKRVEYAASVGADVFVSFHLNSNENTSASGTGVFYPNMNYRPELSEEGKGLAELLFRNLTNLGLSKWSDGVMIRNSEDNTLYPDGSLADYLGIIRRSKEADIMAVLIEHAFLSNSSDVENFLDTDEKLKKLGVADAAAIIEYYNLEQATEYKYGDAKISFSNEKSSTLFTIKADGISNAHGVRFAVWSAANGQDDLKWYDATKQKNGIWVTDVPIKYHVSVGTYYVHTYISTSTGSMYIVDGTTTNVSDRTTGSVSITNRNVIRGVFDIIVSNVSSLGGVQKVYVPVWSEADQSDIIWYEALKQEDGTYKVSVDVVNHDCNFQNYQAHAYVLNGAGEMKFLSGATVEMYRTDALVKASLNENGNYISISAKHIPGTCAQSLKKVVFAVWSQKNGQDDLQWYTATAWRDEYVADIPIENHKDAGVYNIHTYAYYANGSAMLLNGKTIEVKDISVGSVEVKNLNTVAGSFDVVISDVLALGGVQNVYVPVWSKSDQSDIIWYTASKQGDGTYKVHVDVVDHNMNFATYYAHAYVSTGFGAMKMVGAKTIQVIPPNMSIDAIVNDVCSEIVLNATNVPGTNGKSLVSLAFAVWSETNGQDDLQWYFGKLNENTFTVNVPIGNHKDVGRYHVHVYAQKSNGANEFVGNITFDRPLTKIMGESNVTVEQLASYFSENATYPDYYQNTDASSLESFCQMYVDECAVEGVKAEVAFCQAMLETGFLTFGGDVAITQYNFAGIGATGGGTAGNSFSSVREGIRAQVQHLKAYASSDALVQTCVDPRFSYVTRESAPYVEWLGIQENPYGTGWASADDYGYRIRDGYIMDLME